MQKRSRIWFIDRSHLESITAKSNTFAEILRALGYSNVGGGIWYTLKSRLKHEGIDYSHIAEGRNANRGKAYHFTRTVQNNELFCEGSRHFRNVLKRRILSDSLIEYHCAVCDMEPIWNGDTLVLRLDHINGVNNDNRIENLRFVCPNCDSQLPTYGGRNIQRPIKYKEPRTYKTKIEWPPDDKLYEMVWQKPASIIGEELGVSGRAVAKHCDKRGIKKPGPGYWAKCNAKRTA